MEVKNLAAVQPATGVSELNKGGLATGAIGSGPSFEDSLSEILGGKVKNAEAKLEGQSVSEGLKFSNHAIERMRDRGIALRPEEMAKLNDAVDKAAKKGSRETLVLMGETAMIVSVKNKTVVTAMDRNSMKDKVFSNIDSTVIL
jgi:flagellar operon protein